MASVRYESVRKYYERGLWNEGQVKQAVEKGWISALEYREITGEEYREGD